LRIKGIKEGYSRLPIPFIWRGEEVMLMGKSRGVGCCGEPEICVKRRGGEAHRTISEGKVKPWPGA